MSAKGAQAMRYGAVATRMRSASAALARKVLGRSIMAKAGVAAGALALAGCVSFGPDLPDQLYTLTPTTTAPAGSAASGNPAAGLAVLEPLAVQRLTVTRVPVMIDEASVAYLQDAIWVERPARLFQRLLAETIRAQSNRLVLSDDDLQYAAETKLSGRLIDMGYDVPTSSAVVRYDAVLQLPDGQVLTRRFESAVPGIAAEASVVGPALNQAANQVAAEVAAWVG